MQHFSKKFERVGASPKFPRSFPEVSRTFCSSADSRRRLLCGLFLASSSARPGRPLSATIVAHTLPLQPVASKLRRPRIKPLSSPALEHRRLRDVTGPCVVNVCEATVDTFPERAHRIGRIGRIRRALCQQSDGLALVRRPHYLIPSEQPPLRLRPSQINLAPRMPVEIYCSIRTPISKIMHDKY